MVIQILKTVKLATNLYLRAGDIYESPIPKEVEPYLNRPEFVKILVADKKEEKVEEKIKEVVEQEVVEEVKKKMIRRKKK
jgi:hypothetical protein